MSYTGPRHPVAAHANEAQRCRMHGGKGSGAPKGNRNARKSGLYTAPMLCIAALARAAIREERQLNAATEIWLRARERKE